MVGDGSGWVGGFGAGGIRERGTRPEHVRVGLLGPGKSGQGEARHGGARRCWSKDSMERGVDHLARFCVLDWSRRVRARSR